MDTVFFDFLLVGKSGPFVPLFIAPFRDPLPVRIQRIGMLSFPNILSSFRQNRTMSMRNYTMYPETF